MKDEDLAVDIMKAIVDAVDVPVTMKTRLGWDKQHLNAASLCRKAQDVGVQMVTLHGRTRCQMYNGEADWEAVACVKEVLDIPLVVNGDILTPQDAKRAQDIAGADGVMIGRGCQGKPWMLRDTIAYLRGKDIPKPPTGEVLHALIRRHYDDILVFYGERRGVALARKHLAWYCDGLRGAAEFRRGVNSLSDPHAVKAAIDDFFLVTESVAA